MRAVPLLLLIAGCAKPEAAPLEAPAERGAEAPLEPVGAEPITAVLAERLGREALAATYAPKSPGARVYIGDTYLPTRGGTDFRGVYKKAAPATVIVSHPAGHGSGVIIDASGLVLTNEHVVRGAPLEDMRPIVKVEIGQLDKDGVMQRTGEVRTGHVLKVDTERDLALIRLEPGDKKSKLPYAPLAKSSPTPGQPVAAIGHAGIGLLWAIKDGEVAAVGKLGDALVDSLAYDCAGTDPECAAAKQAWLAGEGMGPGINEGKVVQTTCPIAHGDSGGPLVDEDGKVVGLNAFGRWKEMGPMVASFHVHLEELQSFVGEVPEAAPRMLPDPWRDGGPTATLIDVDLDGSHETLRFSGQISAARLLDLDENSPLRGQKLEDVVRARGFDAEVAEYADVNQHLVWYDTDDDGAFDVVTWMSGTDEAPVCSTHPIVDGVVGDATPQDGPCTVWKPALLKDAAQRTRWESMLASYAKDEQVEGRRLPVPSVVGAIGTKGADVDADGIFETVQFDRDGRRRVLIDADQDVGAATAEILAKTAVGRGIDAELGMAVEGNEIWIHHDTNGDGKFDLATWTPNLGAAPWATRAWRKDGEQWVEAPEWLGRTVVAPHVTSDPARAQAIALVGFGAVAVGRDATARGTLPGYDPTAGEVIRQPFGTVQRDMTAMPPTLAFDVDGDSPPMTDGAAYDAEFVIAGAGAFAWMFHDTDGDGFHDVAFAVIGEDATIDAAWRLGTDGSVTWEPAFVGQDAFRANPYTDKRMGTKVLDLLARIAAG